MNRLIALSIKTTGLNRERSGNPFDSRTWVSFGHAVKEIQGIEIIDGLTGMEYHTCLNPSSGVDTTELSKEFPEFHEIGDNFLDYVVGSTIIFDDAEFCLEFLDKELALWDRHPPLCRFLNPKNPIVCMKKATGGLNLDELCEKYQINTPNVNYAWLTAMCYLSMIRAWRTSEIKRSVVDDCLDEFINKYENKPERVLLKEIKAKIRSLR